MEDRARQAQVKLALEPEWEAKFESHSFGFRPGRSAHDALRIIYQCICDLPRYVLDADIAKCSNAACRFVWVDRAASVCPGLICMNSHLEFPAESESEQRYHRDQVERSLREDQIHVASEKVVYRRD